VCEQQVRADAADWGIEIGVQVRDDFQSPEELKLMVAIAPHNFQYNQSSIQMVEEIGMAEPQRRIASPHSGAASRPNIDLGKDTIDSVKLSADQGSAFGQCCHGMCLWDGIEVSKDLKGAAHYFKLSADQGNAEGQYLRGMCLADGVALPPRYRNCHPIFQNVC
jgi:hypothetical protein